MATVQTKTTHTAYVPPMTGSQFAQGNPLPLQGRDVRWLNWTENGGLFASDGLRLWRMRADGKDAIQIVADSTAELSDPSSCGRYLVFTWRFHDETNSSSVWRVDADGSNPVRLTSGGRDRAPVCSPDQKWVYYHLGDISPVVIGRVSLNGSGKPETLPQSGQFPGYIVHRAPRRSGSWCCEMSISPDGKMLAYPAELTIVPPAQFSSMGEKVALLSLESSTAPRLLTANPHISGGVQFTPDGKGISYPIRENGIDNLWVQPLDGSAGHQITNFSSDQIDSFHWSPDGKSLALLRSHSESDVVLLQESKP